MKINNFMKITKSSFNDTLMQSSIQDDSIGYFPKDIAKKGILVYITALCLVSLFFYSHIMPWWLWAFGLISVCLFLFGSNYLTKLWYHIPLRTYTHKLFLWSFAIRALYAIFIYYFNLEHYGTYYESSDGDINWYVPSAFEMAQQLREGDFTEIMQLWIGWGVDITDLGYIIYLSILNLITDSISDVILPLMLKSIYGALTCVMMYRVAQRHFGEHVGRMTGIFCMLQANMIWWCGSMMKETEMVFIMVWFVHEMDRVLSLGHFKLKNLTGAILLALILFTLRSALGIVAFGSMFLSLLLTSSKIVNLTTKIVVVLLLIFTLSLSYGKEIVIMTKNLQEQVENNNQTINMEWRAERKDGNQFAKYAGAAVFAPLIFTLPFPNMVYTFQGQEMLMMVSGGNFIKNILSFFVIIVMLMFLFTGEWRKHTFLISMLCGYLIALVFSNFAQSGRFHMPALPLELMFAAYGISIMYKNRMYRRWFNYALVLEIVICFAWAWFKLAGRGIA